MYGNLVLLVNLIGIFLTSGILSDNISVRMILPDQVRAGESFQVIISIDKGNLQGFSRFQQILPYGLAAERVSSSNADFSFEEQRVRFIWLKLPDEDSLTLVYNVRVEDILKGSFKLTGEFSFIEGNTRKTLSTTAEKNISIIPSKLIADSLLVDIKDYEAIVMSRLLAENNLASLMVQRKDPVKINQREYRVEMKVSKGSLNHYAKIEEHIPEGFTALEDNSRKGIFSFQNQTMKILWKDIPEEPEFVISYRLFKNAGIATGSPNIKGTFSYIAGNRTQSIEIIQKNYDLAVLTSGDTVRNLAALRRREAGIKGQDQITAQGDSVQTAAITQAKDNAVLLPENGIYYRVQLLASHDELDVKTHFRDLKLILDVKFENHEGLKKYTVGSFSNYKDANDYCIFIWKNTKIKDAFVTAYYNGKRIPLKEALKMQKR